MTQLEMARQGIVSDKMKQAAANAGIDAEILRQRIAEGTAIVCHNNRHTNGRPWPSAKACPPGSMPISAPAKTTPASTKSWIKPASQ